MQIVGIFLAAGHSRRFGTDNKLMQRLAGGTLLGLSSAQHLLKALPQSIAVVRPDTLRFNAALAELGLSVIVCDDDAQEMGDSIVLGTSFAHDIYPELQGYIIALADMPFVQSATIITIAEKLLKGATIVAPRYQGQRGHPVGFSAKFTDELMHLSGDQGARALFDQYPSEVEYFETDDAGVLMDIDTPEDLKRNMK